MQIHCSLSRIADCNRLKQITDSLKKSLFFSFFCFLVCQPAGGQTEPPVGIPDYKQAIITPQATLMNMYGNYPVDLANGLVDISIPLHTVSTSWFSFPISTKFHASGLRADEQEGLLGVRWLMDATYSITRTVRGYPDDKLFMDGTMPHSFDNRVGNPDYTPDFATLWGASWTPDKHPLSIGAVQRLSNYSGPEGYWKDTEYDVFTYHLPSGKSGKFILRDSMGVKIPCLMPYEPIKIEIDRAYPTSAFTHFRITDENGVTYRYKSGLSNGMDYVPEWNLETILSPDRRDSIVFEYNHYLTRRIPPRMIEARVVQDHFEWRYDPILDEYPEDWDIVSAFFDAELRSPHSEYIIPPVWLLQTNYHLSAIRFKGGKVEFNYGSVYGSKYLASLVVFDNTSTPVKRIAFTYKQPDKPGTENEKAVLLDKLAFVNPQTGAGHGEEYRFDYYNAEYYPATNPAFQNEMESDWWGYYLRGGDNLILDVINYRRGALHWRHTHSVNNPDNYQTTIGNKTFDKNSNVEDMKVGMLKSIVYPTGGKTIFHYESNRYLNRDNVSTPCGGLRIQMIENIPVNGQSELKIYKYNPHKGGNGAMPSYLYPPDPRGGSKNFISESTVENEYRFGNIGFPEISFLYARYLYSNALPGQFSTFTSNAVYYEKVVEYWGTESANNGYTEHEYMVNMPETEQYNHQYTAIRTNQFNSRQFIHVKPPVYGESPVRLHKKTVYDKNGQPIQESLFEYIGFPRGSVFDMPIQRLWGYKLGAADSVFYASPQMQADWHKLDELIRTEYTDYQQFAWLHQEYRLGASRLTKETVKHHTANGIITTVKTLEYDSKYLFPVKETISSTGSSETLSTTYKYPHQYTTQPYTNMVQRNILSPVIEKAAYKGTTLLEKGITNYRLWGTDHHAPSNYQHQRQGANLETRLVYDYNLQSGHLQAAVKDGIQKVIYIRDACGQPVAMIEQADYSQVSNLLGTTRIQRIANSFVVGSDDMAALNQLRTQLPDALVSTYVYKPLVGILTATAPSGIVTRYEYDDQGRLKHIVDQDGDLVEKYEYHYVNQ